MAKSQMMKIGIDQHFELAIYATSRKGHVLDRETLEANGVDHDLAAAAEGNPDCDSNVVIRWSRKSPLPLARLVEVAEKPTDHEISTRTKELSDEAEFVAQLTEQFKLVRGADPSPKEVKAMLRENAAAELIAERHQLYGLTKEAKDMVTDEAMRLRLLTTGATEKELMEKFGPGTDVHVFGENADGESHFATRSLQLELAEDATWEYSRTEPDGTNVDGTYAFWRLPAPKRFGKAQDNCVHRACRTGLKVDGQYVPTASFLVYYRKPEGKRRGTIVAIPMLRLKALVRFKYNFLAKMYNDWKDASES